MNQERYMQNEKNITKNKRKTHTREQVAKCLDQHRSQIMMLTS